MKKLMFLSVLTASLCAVPVFADELQGVISDSHCGAAHSTASAKSVTCVKKCLGMGSDAVLVSDGKVMKLDADSQEKAKAFAGESVKINGTVNADTVTISSIEKASK